MPSGTHLAPGVIRHDVCSGRLSTGSGSVPYAAGNGTNSVEHTFYEDEPVFFKIDKNIRNCRY